MPKALTLQASPESCRRSPIQATPLWSPGSSPAKHGIIANSPFDPFSKNLGGWYWYAEDLSPDAMGRVRESKNPDWPRRLAGHCQREHNFNIAQYWRAENTEDRKLIRALSTPGL